MKKRTVVRRALATGLSMTLLWGAPQLSALEPPAPTLKLTATDTKAVALRYGKRAMVDAGIYLSALNGPLDLELARTNYDEPVALSQIMPDGVERSLPSDVLDEWNGLADFMTVEVYNEDGKLIRSGARTFCPNSYERQRVNDQGPVNPTYPYGCFTSPFAQGMVWGIDAGWAVNPFDYEGLTIRVPNGNYRVTVGIAERYQELFQIAPEDASVTLDVRVKKAKRDDCRDCHHRDFTNQSSSTRTPATAVPDMDDPDPAILPDLAALPSWGISVRNNRHGRSHLNFGATVWVKGGSSLVVEGFRRAGDDVMDAYQYFYSDGEPIGRSQVGTFEFDARRGHHHWHFQQFARYSLLDATSEEIVRSGKEAFCLAPTDAVDLLLPNAVRSPDNMGLFTNCGSPNSIWIRETLPLGWGDTYFQGLPGQSFDITNLPNGTYYISVEANPGGLLHEQSGDNNVELREIILRGKPTNRKVTVPPWHGIDTH